MTRREEIEKVANEFYKGDEVSTFVVAAQWADKTMIERICEWVENHIFDFPWYDNEQSDFSSKDIANALRKAMEE